jgi:hypothetical protein
MLLLIFKVLMLDFTQSVETIWASLDCQTGGFYPEVGIQEANLRPTCDQSVHSNV